MSNINKDVIWELDNHYRPSEDAFKFIAFLRASGNEKNDSPEVHYRIADALFSSDKKDRKLLLECARGLAKSTIVEYAVIYAASLGEWPGFGEVPFFTFLGASQEGNVKQFFKNVASKVSRSDFLSQYITVEKSNDDLLVLRNLEGFKTTILGKGMSTNFRGLRDDDGNRPTVVIADDILDNKVATSDKIRETIKTNWYNSVLPALDPTGYKIIYIGTPISDKDLISEIKASETFRVERYPMCEKFPCNREDFKSIWTDRFTYEYTDDIFKMFKGGGTTQGFYQEYLLELTDLSTLLVNEEDINWFDPKIVEKYKSNYNFYIVTDFATSAKKSADFSTIGVFAINNKGDWMLVDGQAKRQNMPDNLDDLFRYVKKWKPYSVGVETSGQQNSYLDFLKERMFEKNIWFNLAKMKGKKEEGMRPSKDKVYRFVTGVQPLFKLGKIWFPRIKDIGFSTPYLKNLVVELENELSKFTLAGGVEALAHDDALDLLNQLSEMEIIAPNVEYEYDEGFVDDSGNIWFPEDDNDTGSGSSIVF